MKSALMEKNVLLLSTDIGWMLKVYLALEIAAVWCYHTQLFNFTFSNWRCNLFIWSMERYTRNSIIYTWISLVCKRYLEVKCVGHESYYIGSEWSINVQLVNRQIFVTIYIPSLLKQNPLAHPTPIWCSFPRFIIFFNIIFSIKILALSINSDFLHRRGIQIWDGSPVV